MHNSGYAFQYTARYQALVQLAVELLARLGLPRETLALLSDAGVKRIYVAAKCVTAASKVHEKKENLSAPLKRARNRPRRCGVSDDAGPGAQWPRLSGEPVAVTFGSYVTWGSPALLFFVGHP